jgi:PST family polysaccharide transporter
MPNSGMISAVQEAERLRGVEALGGAAEGGAGGPPSSPQMAGAGAGGDGPVAETVGPMGSHAAKGFAFMVTQAMVTRVIALVCQVALARILIPEHYGLIAIADTVAMLANLLQLIGVREVLVARQRKFAVWANAAFWITLVTGLAAGAITALSGPVLASMLKEPDLILLMGIIALGMPIGAASLVPEARVQSQLRFKLLAALTATNATLLPVLTVALAAAGLGPFAFVLPRLVVAVVRLVVLLRAARLDLRRDPQFDRWKYIVSSSSVVFFTSLLLVIAQIGERPILGAFVGPHQTGLYYFAYTMCFQTIVMVSINLEQVLFATLTRLRDDAGRLLSAFLRASRVLAAIVVPLCLIQAAVSDAAVRTIFGLKWLDAITAMQILGVAMAFPAAYCPASALLQAQQRFRTRFKLAAASSVFCLGLAVAGIALGLHFSGTVGAVTGTAIGVGVGLAVVNPVWSYVTLRPLGAGWATTLGIIVRPLIASGLAVALGLAAGAFAQRLSVGWEVKGVVLEHWVRLVTIGGVAALAYIPLMRGMMPTEFSEVAARVAAAVGRASPAAGRTARRLAGVR